MPLSAKLLATALGIGLTAVLLACEVPLEAVLGLLIPFVGVALDAVVDGLEIILMPIVIATMLIRFVAPRSVVEAIGAERYGLA